MCDTKMLAAKAEARRAAQVRRAQAFSAWQQQSRSAAGAALARYAPALRTLLQSTPKLGAPPVVSAYLAMGTELDPLPLLGALRDAGAATCLPVVPGKGVPLIFRAWAPGDSTVSAGFGTREPAPARPEVEPDLLLVPLLAFDRKGFRLGYGGGYYDRTLRGSRARRAVLAIGIAFDAQEVDDVPHLDYDERLDAVVTPAGLRSFMDRV